MSLSRTLIALNKCLWNEINVVDRKRNELCRLPDLNDISSATGRRGVRKCELLRASGEGKTVTRRKTSRLRKYINRPFHSKVDSGTFFLIALVRNAKDSPVTHQNGNEEYLLIRRVGMDFINFSGWEECRNLILNMINHKGAFKVSHETEYA